MKSMWMTDSLCCPWVILRQWAVQCTSQSQMAGCVLVDEGGVVDNVGHGNRRMIFYQGDLAEIAGVFIHCNQCLQHLLALVCNNLDHLSLFKAEAEVLDALAAQHQWFGGIDDTLGAKFFRRGAKLFGRDVGMERDSVRRSFAWTKLGVRSQGNGKVGSIGSGVVQFGKVVGIQFDSDFILSAVRFAQVCSMSLSSSI